MVVNSARDIDGTVTCPKCDESCGDANLKICDSRSSSGRIVGGSGNIWVYLTVKHKDCGHKFEIGGQAGVTSESA